MSRQAAQLVTRSIRNHSPSRRLGQLLLGLALVVSMVTPGWAQSEGEPDDAPVEPVSGPDDREVPDGPGSGGDREPLGGGDDASSPAGPAAPLMGPIASVEILCDLPRCRDEREMSRLRNLTDLVVGKTYRPELGRAAVTFLERTGLFVKDGVRIQTSPGPGGGVDVLVETEGATYIREVEIDAGLSLESEIEQRIFMRSGSPYEPSRTQQQIESIQSMFERDGYYGTQVQIIAVEVEPYLVDLQFIIDKGQRLDIRDIYVRGHTVFSYQEIRATLLDAFGFFRTFTADAFDEGLQDVLDDYRETGYLEARFETREAVPDPSAGSVDLYVAVREGRHWTIIFTGNRQFERDELMEALPYLDTGFVDPTEVRGSVKEVEALYRTGGYFFADVTVNIDELGEDEMVVRYTIFEGSQAEIRAISFEGNENVPGDTLLDLMSTRVYGVLETGGYLQPEQLEGDILTIEAYYHELGYLSAHVPRWVVVAEDEGRSLYVTVFINEGEQTRVTEVRFRGNQLFDDSFLRRRLRVRASEPFVTSALRADESLIRNLYRARGHRPQKADAVCLVDGVEVPCRIPSFPRECRRVGPEQCSERRRGARIIRECPRIVDALSCELTGGILAPEVTVEHRILEGELLTVGEIFVIGNYETDRDVIRDEIPLVEGRPFNPNDLLEGQANLRTLGIFNSVRVSTIGVGSQTEQVEYQRNRAAIVVKVEEAGTQFIEYRLGLSSQSNADTFRVIAENELGYIDRNFLGRALRLQVVGGFQFDLLRAQDVFDESAGTAAVTYGDPRFDWFGLAEDPWEAATTGRFLVDTLSATLHERSIEGEVEFRQEFAALHGLFFNLSANIKRAESKSPDQGAFEDPRLILGLSPSLILDRRNNPLNPTRGYRADLVIELADQFFGAGVDSEEFTKIRLSGSYLFTFARHFVVGTYARFGFTVGGILSGFQLNEEMTSDPESRLTLPPTERYRLGGVSGLRGYPDNSLGPTNAIGEPLFGDIVVNGTVELRFPLVPAIDFYGAWFVDAGQLTADFDDLALDGFRYSTGLGVRWLAFGLVPVVFDYGMVLDRRVGETIGQLHFNVGYTF